MSKSRDGFERWALLNGYSVKRDEEFPDVYHASVTRGLWIGWQAGQSAEREQWRSVAVPALEWMEGAWERIDQEWGPSGKTLDQECADGDEPEIAAMRKALAEAGQVESDSTPSPTSRRTD